VSKKKSEQFEEALKKLEGIVDTMERGNLPLEEAMEAFTEGIRLVKFCHQKLEEAESKIQIFLGAQDGGPVVAPFPSSPVNDTSE
jgi:exodeoxyribonuclease VII small subunit